MRSAAGIIGSSSASSIAAGNRKVDEQRPGDRVAIEVGFETCEISELAHQSFGHRTQIPGAQQRLEVRQVRPCAPLATQRTGPASHEVSAVERPTALQRLERDGRIEHRGYGDCADNRFGGAAVGRHSKHEIAAERKACQEDLHLGKRSATARVAPTTSASRQEWKISRLRWWLSPWSRRLSRRTSNPFATSWAPRDTT